VTPCRELQLHCVHAFCTSELSELPEMCTRAQIVEALNEAVLLAGFFAAGRRAHQERLQWGRAPSLLARLCALPAAYSASAGGARAEAALAAPNANGSQPSADTQACTADLANDADGANAGERAPAGALRHVHLEHVLMPTLAAACAGVPRNCEVVQQALGLQTLVAYAHRCRERGAAQVPGLPARFDPRRRLLGDACQQLEQAVQVAAHVHQRCDPASTMPHDVSVKGLPAASRAGTVACDAASADDGRMRETVAVPMHVSQSVA
jgi:hypothetical protein